MAVLPDGERRHLAVRSSHYMRLHFASTGGGVAWLHDCMHVTFTWSEHAV
jgi:hypothetical protein